MKSVCVTITNPQTGETWTPIYECHNGDTLAAIINGTMDVLNGSTITSIEVY